MIKLNEETFFDAGKKHSEEFGREIQGFAESISGFSIVNQIKPRFVPFRLIYTLLKRHSRKHIRPLIEKHTPKNYEYIQGLSESSGVDIDDFVLFASANLYLMRSIYYSRKYLDGAAFPLLPEHGDFCSCVIVSEDQGKEKKALMLKNLDYMKDLEHTVLNRDITVEGSNRVISQAFSVMSQTTEGINEHGLCISMNNAYALDKPSSGVPLSMIITEALYSCSTISDATKFITTRPVGNSGIVNIIDSNGEFASIQISSSNYQVIKQQPDEDIRFYTNFYKSEKMISVGRKKYVEGAINSSRNDRVRSVDRKWLTSAINRDKAIQRFIKKNSRDLDVEKLQELACDCGEKDAPDFDTICMDGISATIGSSIFDPINRVVWLTEGSPYNSEFRKFGFD